ncbi:patatin-like phospholipase family protein [Pedobacter cryotolerans]|uniref:Patatin n=1 Tax=Pedobacter cryotolerans TaxID=2571270 RepID=A0A4U1C2F8_9SPHI|nr:patatin-like phospholipase family protein [Pedobacter cryotolerans]TKB99884.1 patatin [Pedobacter cryotolerans]
MQPIKLLIFILFACVFNVNAQKVGLVLSGGGAKGLAHIGTLKALEENNIPIDYITGTSMGGIVGAMYAAGYSPSQIEKIALSSDFQDWVGGKYKSDYSYYFQKNTANAAILTAKLSIDTSLRLNFRQNLVNDIPLNFALLELFSQASAISKDNFENLFVPYRCMVSDVLSQKSIIMKNGSLAEAVRGTMTVPLVYRPIKLENKYVFDGGLYNNFPADVMKNEFKPDFIIGANVSSKTFNEYPKNDDKLMNRFLVYMFLSKSDSTLVGENGVYIQPDLIDYNVTNFAPVAELIKKGYDATIADMDNIKKTVKRRVTPKELATKRASFNDRKPDLVFSNVTVSGVNSQQKKYIERLFKSDQATFNLKDIKTGYYKLVADETFETVYPKISYQAQTDSYNFEIVAQPKKSFKIDFGGNISSRPISNVYLGLQYNYLNRKAYTFGANFYSGRFYESAQLSGRIDYPSGLPLFLAAELTYNHWNYYNTSQIFIENPKPVYIEQGDRKIDIKLGMPLNRNARLTLSAAFINNNDSYSPTNTFRVGDVLDRTVFNGLRTSLYFEQNSLNRKQYADRGHSSLLSLNFSTGKENYTPGNIFRSTTLTNNQLTVFRKFREWAHIKISDERYFYHSKKYTLGYAAEAVISNQPLFNNYYATLLTAPAFYPINDSKSLFLENFRASSYLAGGVKNIYNLKHNLDLRVEGYAFIPYKGFEQKGLQGVGYAKAFSKWHYAGTAGLVYHTPVGPISFSYNLYDDPLKRNGVLLHLGYLIYNKRSIE